MGCGATSKDFSISTENNLVALVVTNKTDLIIDKIREMGQNFNCNAPINFRGDTLLHYACAKNNQRLVEYLIQLPDQMKSIKNKLQQKPVDLSENDRIKELCS